MLYFILTPNGDVVKASPEYWEKWRRTLMPMPDITLLGPFSVVTGFHGETPDDKPTHVMRTTVVRDGFPESTIVAAQLFPFDNEHDALRYHNRGIMLIGRLLDRTAQHILRENQS